MMNIMEKLAREIMRVTTLKQRYHELEGMPQVNVRPALMLMQGSLEEACVAMGSDDVGRIVRAGRVLEGFTQ